MSIQPVLGGRWISDDGEIRVTPEGQPSVFDMIKVLGGQRNPRDVWERLVESHPEIADWVCMYKFEGAGQRATPVLQSTYYVYQLEQLLSVGLCKGGRAIPRGLKSPRITESSVQNALVKYLIECGENPKTFVSCRAGVADIVTAQTVIEVKVASAWKAAVGQALAYANDLNRYPEVAIYGKANYQRILVCCTELGVACTCYPTESLTSFILGKGAPTYDNLTEISQQVRMRVLARLN